MVPNLEGKKRKQANWLSCTASHRTASFHPPQIVMFVTGKGIATARSLLESGHDVPNLSPHMRTDIRVYYLVRQALAFLHALDVLMYGTWCPVCAQCCCCL